MPFSARTVEANAILSKVDRCQSTVASERINEGSAADIADVAGSEIELTNLAISS